MSKKPEPKEVTAKLAKFTEVQEAHPVSASKSYNYNIGLHENIGEVVMTGNTNGSVGRWDFVALYTSPPPTDPNQDYVTYFYVEDQSSLQTSEPWGTGYYVAYASWDYRLEKYVKLCEAGPT